MQIPNELYNLFGKKDDKYISSRYYDLKKDYIELNGMKMDCPTE